MKRVAAYAKVISFYILLWCGGFAFSCAARLLCIWVMSNCSLLIYGQTVLLKLCFIFMCRQDHRPSASMRNLSPYWSPLGTWLVLLSSRFVDNRLNASAVCISEVVVSSYMQFLWIYFHFQLLQIHSVVDNLELQVHIPSHMLFVPICL
jgi:hypothetical protein